VTAGKAGIVSEACAALEMRMISIQLKNRYNFVIENHSQQGKT